MSLPKNKTLGFVGGQAVYVDSGGRFTHITTGRILEYLAKEHETIYWATSTVSQRRGQDDYPIPDNVQIVEIPHYTSMLGGLKCLRGIRAGYKRLMEHHPDRLFIRGVPPGIVELYRGCAKQGISPLHWLVGNPIALLKSHRRAGRLKTFLALNLYKHFERGMLRGSRRCKGAFLCNGQELYKRCAGTNRHVTVSSVIAPDELIEKHNSCLSDPVKVLAVCFVRPEKGIQYLIEAMSLLTTKRPVELHVVGSRERYAGYQAQLDARVKELGLDSTVTWEGHATAEEVDEHMKQADLFVLPTLSEGTPHSIVEALAHSLPVVSTTVGGNPTVIQDGVNGLLVPPKDPAALAGAIDKIIDNDEIRRSLIAGGFARAKEITVDKFIAQVMGIYAELETQS